ncbi:hypothetical protein BRARA_B02328 [Brassica rapa]|uniref:Uncharacterized protein n=1 Tax=Brassica campestris TaxID=3711 RepID=A0A398ACQ8_BRACM|nr:uncharacterized protein LOC103853119 isoform X1 [Brassica rapa]RID75275.1 hypothetical protein BRARA_B02328 [Brassica rapa]VDC89219.1 unnamed protein product [Brassica rapa]
MRERLSSSRDPTITIDSAVEKEGETRREVEELRRKLAIEKKRMNRVKLCNSMELLLLVVLVLLLSTFVLVFFLPSP